jgi:hypothetical protein
MGSASAGEFYAFAEQFYDLYICTKGGFMAEQGWGVLASKMFVFELKIG